MIFNCNADCNQTDCHEIGTEHLRSASNFLIEHCNLLMH